MLLQKRCFKNISKFREILATAMESISRKGSFLKLVNVFWKRTLPQLFFYIATLISSKLWILPIHSIMRRDLSFCSFPFFDRKHFLFSLDFWKWRVQLCRIGRHVGKWSVIYMTNFWGRGKNISSWYFQIRKRTTQRLA